MDFFCIKKVDFAQSSKFKKLWKTWERFDMFEVKLTFISLLFIRYPSEIWMIFIQGLGSDLTYLLSRDQLLHLLTQQWLQLQKSPYLHFCKKKLPSASKFSWLILQK